MRFQKEIKPIKREVTKRRIGCAVRAIQKQKNKIPLFQAIMEWPTPEERIGKIDQSNFEHFNKMRKLALKMWKEGRKIYQSLPQARKIEFKNKWNTSGCPARAEYFLDNIKNYIKSFGEV